MGWPILERLRFVASELRTIDWVLWLGLVGMTIALAVLAWTRWGQSKPLQKCFVLSLLAHMLIATYATSVSIVTNAPLRTREVAYSLSLVDGGTPEGDGDAGELSDPQTTSDSNGATAPWTTLTDSEPVDIEAQSPEPKETVAAAEPTRTAPTDDALIPPPTQPTAEPAEAVVESQPDAEAAEAHSVSEPSTSSVAGPTLIEVAKPQAKAVMEPALPDAPRELATPIPRDISPTATADEPLISGLPEGIESDLATQLRLPELPDMLRSVAEGSGAPTASGGSYAGSLEESALVPIESGGSSIPAAALPASVRAESLVPIERSGVPAPYQMRLSPDRAAAATREGATPQSESAVAAALAWLARSQEPDGHWNPLRFGANIDRQVLGQPRLDAGKNVETGITGLALLAFLGAGQTHTEGQYASNVQRGIDYLLRAQAADGSLGGQAVNFSFMYCHAMASLPLSEAYALTGDTRLTTPVSRALAYSLSAQHRSTGGWRYKPGDLGDTSQLGWQLMFLKSAEWAGFRVPPAARDGAARFLGSVSSGRQGGLASYRPQERPGVTMTAEALTCRLLLGRAPSDAASREALDFVMTSLPGDGPDNFYFWYYATFAVHLMQGEAWSRWNERLQARLLPAQRTSGPDAGSWDATCQWGGYGGRVYTTAMATLSLEVYYRLLPIHERTAGEKRPGEGQR